MIKTNWLVGFCFPQSPRAHRHFVLMAPANSKSLQLNELNQRSAPLASFDVAMFYPRIEDYGYTDKKTKKAKKGATFRCIVVSRENPQQYMVAELAMRAETRAPLEKALEKFKNGLCFRGLAQ